MLAQIQLVPEQASSIAPRVDMVATLLLAISGFFTVLIFVMLIYFAARYRRRHPDQQGAPVVSSTRLELTWTIIPLIIVLGVYAISSDVYFEMINPPDDCLEVYVVGKQWMWYTQHLGGQRENQGLTVPVGRAVKLTMNSQDVIHDFAIPAFRVRMDVIPGRTTHLWFRATKPGKYHLFCAEYCGTNHSRMVGWVTVLEQDRFQEWLDSIHVDGSPATEGRKLFQKLQCITCHSGDALARGPLLEGLYGTRNRPLEGGGVVDVDEEYIRESILNPDARVAAGYKAIMPSFKGQVNEQEMIQLVAFIRSLRTARLPARTEETDPPPAAAPPTQPGAKSR